MKSRLRSYRNVANRLSRDAALRSEAIPRGSTQRSLWAADLALEAGRAIKRRPSLPPCRRLMIAQACRALRWLSKGWQHTLRAESVRRPATPLICYFGGANLPSGIWLRHRRHFQRSASRNPI
jgi:hypothetical protein